MFKHGRFPDTQYQVLKGVKLIKNSLFFLSSVMFYFFAFINVGHAAMGEFVVIDKAAPATLREEPNGTNSLGKIPAGTKIEIRSKKDIRSGILVVTWYEVDYNGKKGWISQHVTMGDITKEDDSGTKNVVREKGADEVRHGTFNKQVKEDFKSWALNNTAATYLEYPEGSDWQIWIRLSPEKYTTKDNVQSIAVQLARAYKMQTGFDKLVIVTVWHPYKSEVFSKGRL